MKQLLQFACIIGAAALVAPRLGAQPADASISGLPVNWTVPKGTPSHYAAVFMTGDGGFADLFSKVAEEIAEHGVGVAGFNSRTWLSPKKTPEATADAIARLIRAEMARFHADSVVVVGYSRGADMAPFVVNRLPDDVRKRVVGITMFGLAPSANFEFHLVDLVKDSNRDSDIPILPELLKLRGTPMVCVYGTEEKTSGCREVPEGLLSVDARHGGHHFDNDHKALAASVLRFVHAPASANN